MKEESHALMLAAPRAIREVRWAVAVLLLYMASALVRVAKRIAP